MGRAASAAMARAASVASLPVLVIDNGGGTVKMGWATDAQPVVVENAKAKARTGKKVLVGAEIAATKNKAGMLFKRPVQRGFVIDVELQREVWASAFSDQALKVQPSEAAVLVTEPLFNFDAVKESMHELAFEEFGFEAMFRAPAADMAAFKACADGASAGLSDGCVVVDSGFSATNVAPYVRGSRVDAGVRRVDVGGKALTNALKDSISYRQIDVSQETYVVNQMKEDVSFVALDYVGTLRELQRAAKAKATHSHCVEYVLPDFGDVHRGYIKPSGEDDDDSGSGGGSGKRKAGAAQTVALGHERFAIPELIFTPSDVGLDQAGVEAAVTEAVASLEPLARPLAYANVVAVGGNSRMPGFGDRLRAEVRASAPADFDSVNVVVPDEPDWYAWRGACAFAGSDGFAGRCVTRDEYNEKGHALCFERFDGRGA